MSDLSLVQGGGSPGSTVPLPLAACQLPPWPPWHGHTKGPVPRVSWARGRWGGLDGVATRGQEPVPVEPGVLQAEHGGQLIGHAIEGRGDGDRIPAGRQLALASGLDSGGQGFEVLAGHGASLPVPTL